jgi:hypothetical protein
VGEKILSHLGNVTGCCERLWKVGSMLNGDSLDLEHEGELYAAVTCLLGRRSDSVAGRGVSLAWKLMSRILQAPNEDEAVFR